MVVGSRCAFVVVLVRYSREVDVMKIHQHATSSLCGSRVGRSTGCVHVNVEHCISFRQVRFGMAGVTEAKTLLRITEVPSPPSSLSCRDALAGVSYHQHNNPSLCRRTTHQAAHVPNSIVGLSLVGTPSCLISSRSLCFPSSRSVLAVQIHACGAALRCFPNSRSVARLG